jgi:hypothetical protein
MILRRDGSIDFRLLAGRLAWYGAGAAIALVIGALAVLAGS